MSTLPALVLAILAIAGGMAATYLYVDDAGLVFRLAAGTPAGLTALGLFGVVFSALFGLTPFAIAASSALAALPLALFGLQRYRSRARADLVAAFAALKLAASRHKARALVYASLSVFVLAVLWLVFDRAMVERPDGIYTTLDNYGDLPFHLAAVSRFLYGTNLPPEDPIYAGARFSYPFLADFIAALFARTGAGLRQAMFIENILLGAALVALLYRFGLELTRDRIAALLTPVVVLFSGGMGWCLLFSDAHSSEKGILTLLGNLPHNYTVISNTGWRFGNILTAMLLTQRSILLGMPLALVVLTLLYRAIAGRGSEPATEQPKLSLMAGAGLAAAILPLAHAHSFVVVVFVAVCLALLFKGWRSWRRWAVFFAFALLPALPQIWWVTHGTAVHGQSFIGVHLGWDRGSDGIIWFWLKNAGPFVILTGLALALRHRLAGGSGAAGAVSGRLHGRRRASVMIMVDSPDEEQPAEAIRLLNLNLPAFLNLPSARAQFPPRLVPKRLLLFYLPFALCFLIPNLLRLSPWVWDNIKIIVYWYIASAPLACMVLAAMWRSGKAKRALAAGLLFLLTAAGGLEVWRVISGASSYRDFDHTEIQFAEMIRQRTPPGSTIMHAPVHNDPVFLSGRRSLLGSVNHVWSHGIRIDRREADMKQIYAGADIPTLVDRYGIDYAVLSPDEVEQGMVNKAIFLAYFTNVGDVGRYSLYRYKFKGPRQTGAQVALQYGAD